MDWQLLTLSVIRAGSALCAAVLALFAYRAYRATHRRALLWLSLASALFMTGFVAAGILYQATGSLAQATVLEAPFTLGALGLMILSVFGRDPSGQRFPRAPVAATDVDVHA